MFKKHLIILMAISLLTACGGGGGGGSTPDNGGNNGGGNNGGGNNGGGNNGGGNNGGGNNDNSALPSSKDTGTGSDILYLSNKNNTFYLGVFHGKRDADSSFTSIDTSTTSITPTNTDGYLSLAVSCYSNLATEVTIYDLQISGSRELDLRCKPETLNNTIISKLEPTVNNDYRFHSAIMGGEGIHFWLPNPASMNAADYNDALRNFSYTYNDNTQRTTWGLYFDSNNDAALSVANLGVMGNIRKQQTNYNDPLNPIVTYEIPYNENGTNHTPDLLDTPVAAHYSLDFYSPSRFAYAFRTSKQITSDTTVAALIPGSLKASGDYYIEQFLSPQGHLYRHITTNPEGSNLFGANGTYVGDTTSYAVNFSLPNSGVMSYSGTPTGIESELTLKAQEVKIFYRTGTAGQQMNFHYHSELLEKVVLVSSYGQAFGDFNDLHNTIKVQFERFDGLALDDAYIASKTIRFFYSNGVAGDGNVTMMSRSY